MRKLVVATVAVAFGVLLMGGGYALAWHGLDSSKKPKVVCGGPKGRRPAHPYLLQGRLHRAPGRMYSARAQAVDARTRTAVPARGRKPFCGGGGGGGGGSTSSSTSTSTSTSDSTSTSTTDSTSSGTTASTPPPTDTTPPTVNCIIPDQSAWYSADVTVNCTASDSGSPPASPASFSLSTSVPSGSETSAASTASQEVCDSATTPNCTTAGPYSFNVDRKAPTATFTDCPSSALILGSSYTAHWTAADTGSGLATAASGSVTLNTSAAGSPSASSPQPQDHVGHTGAAATCAYTVAYKTNQSAAVNKAGTLAVTVQLWNYNNINVSSSSISVKALQIIDSSGNPRMTFSNSFFTFASGIYFYSVSVSSLPSGTYRLQYVAGSDTTTHQVSFTR